MRIKFLIAALLLVPAGLGAQQRLSIEDCRRLAVDSSEELKKARQESRKALLDREVALRSRLPGLDGSATGILSEDIDMAGTTLRLRGAWLAGLTVSQPVYTGGRISSGARLAGLGQEIREIQEEQARMDAIQEAENAYWTLCGVREQIEVLDAYKVQMDSLLRTVETALAAGMSTRADLLKLRSAAADLAYQARKARSGEKICRMVLLGALGLDLDDDVELLTGPEETLAGEPGAASSCLQSPEYRLLEKSLEVSEEQVRSSRAEVLPTVGIGVSYNWYGNMKMLGTTQLPTGELYPYSQKIDGGLGMAMLSVKVPLFDWGIGRRKIAKARSDAEIARLDLEKNARLLDIRTASAHADMEAAIQLEESARLSLEEAEENLALAGERYATGLGTITDLLDARATRSAARSNLISARTEGCMAVTAWKRSTGSL